MLPEPIRWSHATGKRVVPSPWQMTPRPSARFSDRISDRGCTYPPSDYAHASASGSPTEMYSYTIHLLILMSDPTFIRHDTKMRIPTRRMRTYSCNRVSILKLRVILHHAGLR